MHCLALLPLQRHAQELPSLTVSDAEARVAFVAARSLCQLSLTFLPSSLKHRRSLGVTSEQANASEVQSATTPPRASDACAGMCQSVSGQQAACDHSTRQWRGHCTAQRSAAEGPSDVASLHHSHLCSLAPSQRCAQKGAQWLSSTHSLALSRTRSGQSSGVR